MKLTKETLKQIIKEEVEKVLKEKDGGVHVTLDLLNKKATVFVPEKGREAIYAGQYPYWNVILKLFSQNADEEEEATFRKAFKIPDGLQIHKQRL